MRFDLTIENPRVAAGQPAPVTLRMSTGEEAETIPSNPREGDVTTLELLDERGELLESADTSTRLLRLGKRIPQRAQEAMTQVEMPPGASEEWVYDLPAFFDLRAPGRYLVRARFAFLPSGIRAESEASPLEVVASPSISFDFATEQICLPSAACLQTRPLGSSVTFSLGSMVEVYYRGARLAIPEDAAPRLSEADFTTNRSFAHDFFRWAAWLRGATLGLTFADEGQAGPVFEVPLDLESPEMLGRPVQHADRSVSVVLASGDPAAPRKIVRVDVGEDGAVTAILPIATVAGEIAACGADPGGGLAIVALSGGRAPLHLLTREGAGATSTRALLSADDLARCAPDKQDPKIERVLAVRLALKDKGPRAALSVVAFDHDPDQHNQDDLVAVVESPLDGGPARAATTRLPRGFLVSEERLNTADVVRSSTGDLFALVATSKGRVFFLAPGSPLREIGDIDPDRAPRVRLALSSTDRVLALVPSDVEGVAIRVLQQEATLGLF